MLPWYLTLIPNRSSILDKECGLEGTFVFARTVEFDILGIKPTLYPSYSLFSNLYTLIVFLCLGIIVGCSPKLTRLNGSERDLSIGSIYFTSLDAAKRDILSDFISFISGNLSDVVLGAATVDADGLKG